MGNKDEDVLDKWVNKGAKWVQEQTSAGRQEKQRAKINALTVIVGIPVLVVGGAGWLIWQGVKKGAELVKNTSPGGETDGISDGSDPSTPAS